MTISENVLGAPLLQLRFGLDPLLLLGLPLVVFGLCRAGVLGWWALASVVAGTVLLPFSPTSTNLVPGAFLLIQLPLAVAGVRLIARARSAPEHRVARRRPSARAGGTASSSPQPGGHSIRRPPSR